MEFYSGARGQELHPTEKLVVIECLRIIEYAARSDGGRSGIYSSEIADLDRQPGSIDFDSGAEGGRNEDMNGLAHPKTLSIHRHRISALLLQQQNLMRSIQTKCCRHRLVIMPSSGFVFYRYQHLSKSLQKGCVITLYSNHQLHRMYIRE